MEHVSSAASEEITNGLIDGTASDHWELGMAHIKRSLYISVFGGGGPPDGSQKVELIRETQTPTNGVFLPTQTWKEYWDLWVLMLILYSAVMVPFRICFSSPAEGNMFWAEQSVTFTFILDVIFNFNTAYLQDERWVTSRFSIGSKYMQGWFWIDVPSAIPVELIDLLMEGDSSSLGMLRFLRLFRLLRLLRLLKIGEYVAQLEIRFDLNLTFLRIAQMVLQLLFLAHMLGCFWFYIAALVGIDPEIVTWVSTYDDGSGIDAPPAEQYLYAVYWALTTLTTVGYGDITPTNNTERIYSLFALLLGALVFGYMLSSIGSLVAAIDRQAALSEEKMDEVKEYMRWRKLPRDLVIRMRRYYTHYYSRKTAFDEDAILGGLTHALRFEVVRHSLKESIGRIPLFAKTLEPVFQLEVYPLFKPVSAAPGETIFLRGDTSDALFFLIKGTLEVISGFDSRVLYRVREGNHFGETTLTGRRRVATHRAVTFCEMYVLSSEDLMELFRRRPHEGRLIHAAVFREHMNKERLRSLTLRLLINKLSLSQPREAAALKLQVAWGKYLDRIGFGAVAPDLPEGSRRDSAQATPMSTLNDEMSASSPSKIAPSSLSFEELQLSDERFNKLAKLDKLDSLDTFFAKLGKLVDRVEKLSPSGKASDRVDKPPRGGGGRKA